MAPKYETAVRPGEADGTYDAMCACSWSSTGWETKKLAQARLDQHTAEHETGEPAPELVDFREEHGLNGPLVTGIGLDGSITTGKRATATAAKRTARNRPPAKRTPRRGGRR